MSDDKMDDGDQDALGHEGGERPVQNTPGGVLGHGPVQNGSVENGSLENSLVESSSVEDSSAE